MRDLYRKHVRVYEGLRPLVIPLFRRLFALQSVPLPPDVPTPYLVLSNHNTDLDPVLVGASFPRHMYYVSSEHVLRRGLGAWLLKRFFAPIARQKGGTDAAAAMAILRKLRGGANVCLFAEGNRSFNGRTGPMFTATGKMIRAAGCTLVTYRLEGGYFTSPRWSYTLRRGRMKGYPVRIYTPEQLRAMTPEQINVAIARDLFEDAYVRQEAEHIPFRGKRLAEGLETALFLCPQCGRAGTLRTADERIFCDCGLSVVYDEQGFLHDGPFATVTAWDDWQLTRLDTLIRPGAPVFCDTADVTLCHITQSGLVPLAQGKPCLYPDALRVGDTVLPLGDISDMALVGRSTPVFTWDGRPMQLSVPKGFCGRKYLLLYQYLRDRVVSN